MDAFGKEITQSFRETLILLSQSPAKVEVHVASFQPRNISEVSVFEIAQYNGF